LLFSRAASSIAMAVGLTVMTGWYAYWTTVIQISSSFPPMQFNTAVGFFLCGSGSALLMSGRIATSRIAPWLGGRCSSRAVDLLRIRLRQEFRDRSVLYQVWNTDCDILCGANVAADRNLLCLHRRGASYIQCRSVHGAVDRYGTVNLYRGHDHLCCYVWLPFRYRNCFRLGQLHPHGDAYRADIFYP
jgi:hypothetical protein